jgi:hypothetical protein
MKGVRSPAETNDSFSSFFVHNISEVYTASYTMDTGGPFPSGKARPGLEAHHSPHLVPRTTGVIPPLPLRACMACTGQIYLFTLFFII